MFLGDDAFLVYICTNLANLIEQLPSMTRQSISLTPPNDAWLMAQIESSEYSSKSDVVNDLIRKARAAEQQAQYIRAKLIEAEQSGSMTPDRHAILAELKARKKP